MSPEQDCALAYESSCASPSILRTPVAVTRAILKKRLLRQPSHSDRQAPDQYVADFTSFCV
jgi:hypothetical protein